MTTMTHSTTLPLFTAEAPMVTIPQYGVRLVKESEFKYFSNKVTGAAAVCELLRTIGLDEKANEEFYSVYLNTKNHVLGIEMISRGTLNSSLVHPREVFKGALLANANSIILAHNHPSGSVEPSVADRSVTKILANAGNLLDVKVLDHVIIGSKGGFFSFAESGLL
jgi:DNA repair protein RadC